MSVFELPWPAFVHAAMFGGLVALAVRELRSSESWTADLLAALWLAGASLSLVRLSVVVHLHVVADIIEAVDW